MSRAGTETRSFDASRLLSWLRDGGVYAVLVALVLFNAVFTTNFLTTATIFNILVVASPIVLISLGMALTIGTQGIDLSVGSIMALASVATALYLGYGWPVAALIALFVGALAGLVNGSLIALVGVQPIVATLAVLVAGRGFAQLFSGGQLTSVGDPVILALGRGEVAGIPIPVIVAGTAALVVALLMRHTTFGHYILAAGGNRAASVLSGHPVRATLIAVYVVSGLLAAIAGIMATGRLGASDPFNIGVLLELSAIAAVVVGGTPLTGGKVAIVGTVAGAVLMQVISATFVMNNLPFTYAQIITAVIIVAAVYVQKGRGAT